MESEDVNERKIALLSQWYVSGKGRKLYSGQIHTGDCVGNSRDTDNSCSDRWMYKCECLRDIKSDFEETFDKSIKIEKDTLKSGLLVRLIRSLVKIIAPML